MPQVYEPEPIVEALAGTPIARRRRRSVHAVVAAELARLPATA